MCVLRRIIRDLVQEFDVAYYYPHLLFSTNFISTHSTANDGSPPRFAMTVVLTTYEMAIRDVALFRKFSSGSVRWSTLVVDEAQRLKNRASLLFSTLQSLNPHHRVLLSGTPLQNNLGELWSLLSYVCPSVFDNLEQLCAWFNRPFEVEYEDSGESEEDREGNIDIAQNQLNHNNTTSVRLPATSKDLPSVQPLERTQTTSLDVAENNAIVDLECRNIVVSSSTTTGVNGLVPAKKRKRSRRLSHYYTVGGKGRRPVNSFGRSGALNPDETALVISALHRVSWVCLKIVAADEMIHNDNYFFELITNS